MHQPPDQFPKFMNTTNEIYVWHFTPLDMWGWWIDFVPAMSYNPQTAICYDETQLAERRIDFSAYIFNDISIKDMYVT